MGCNNIYNEVIYGEDTANYLDSNMMRIYSAAYKKVYDSWFKVASTDEAILYGMEMMAERCMHPVMYIVRTLFIVLGQLAVIITVIVIIHKRRQERITQEILETPIKDIHDEKVEELLDRYDVY